MQKSQLFRAGTWLRAEGRKDDTTPVRSANSRAHVARLLGAALYFGAVLVAFLAVGDWGQPLLFLASITAGLVSGRWWSVALAPLIVPAALIAEFVSTEEYGGDSVSGPLDAALFAAYFGVLPVAAMIAFGVGLRRVIRRRRNRAVVADAS